MSDYSTSSHETWFSRIGGAFKGILFGLVLFALSFVLLFWNEGRTINRTNALNDAQKNTVSIDSPVVKPENESTLIHVSGKAKTEDVLSDELFGISMTAIKLRRTVEMYQWEETIDRETTRNTGGSSDTKETPRYSKVWSTQVIDSSSFRDTSKTNPSTIPFESQILTAETVTLGEFKLSPSLVSRIDAYKAVKLEPLPGTPAVTTPAVTAPAVTAPAVATPSTSTADNDASVTPVATVPVETAAVPVAMPAVAPTTPATVITTTDPVAVPAPTAVTPTAVPTAVPATVPVETVPVETVPGVNPLLAGYALVNNQYYKGTPASPQIGDIRVSFMFVPDTDVSVISQQQGDTFTPYVCRKNNSEVELLETGIVSAELMYKSAHSSNNMFCWLLRFAGFMMMFIGLTVILKPLVVLSDVLPFLGSLASFGVGVFSFILAASLSLLTIAIGWLFYRPVIGILLIVVAVGLLYLLKKKSPK